MTQSQSDPAAVGIMRMKAMFYARCRSGAKSEKNADLEIT